LTSHAEKKLNLYEVIAIGIGGMIGGGIFAVLGLAITLAGHTVGFTLAAGGVIALLTGISYAAMGVVFRGSGGSFTYIHKSFPSPSVAGFAGWLLVAGYVGTLALYATAFGAYGSALMHVHAHITADLLSAFALGIFLFVNLLGAKLSGGVELGVVAVKLAILAFFAAVGIWGIHASHFVPLFNKGLFTPLAAVALIFVAFEGFELIPNAVDEMENPERNLRRALIIAIVVTTIIYVVVALVALGNLVPAQIVKDQEFVLAVAARPMLGTTGFVMIGIAALLSTASAINATLFGASRLAMVMAAERALPHVFATRAKARSVPWVALLTLTVIAMVFTLAASLTVISVVASATFLLIFTLVNAAAFRQAKQIKLHPALPLTGAILAGASFFILLWHTWQQNRGNLLWLVGFYGAAALAQLVLHMLRARRKRAAA
jgi:amino acid transporter